MAKQIIVDSFGRRNGKTVMSEAIKEYIQDNYISKAEYDQIVLESIGIRNGKIPMTDALKQYIDDNYISRAEHDRIINRLKMLNDEQYHTIQVLSRLVSEYEAMSKVRRIDFKSGQWVMRE